MLGDSVKMCTHNNDYTAWGTQLCRTREETTGEEEREGDEEKKEKEEEKVEEEEEKEEEEEEEEGELHVQWIGALVIHKLRKLD